MRRKPVEQGNIYSSGGLFTQHFIEAMRQPHFRNEHIQPPAFNWDDIEFKTSKELTAWIDSTWDGLRERWDAIHLKIRTMDVSTVREKWLIPFFETLGFSPVHLKESIDVGDSLKFNFSHRGWVNEGAPIIDMVSPEQDLDTRDTTEGRRARPPHDRLQNYLNVHDDQFGLVTNGIFLRLLRDYHHTTTKGYLEFDLEAIFETRSYSDFVTLVRFLHPTRFVGQHKGDCIIESFYKDSIATGIAVGADLQKNVKKAIEALANGFLRGAVISDLQEDAPKCRQFYSEILNVIYRILFQLFAEQRGLMPGRNSLYATEYSIVGLRERAIQYRPMDDDHTDLWNGLKVTFSLVKNGCPEMEVFGYNGLLFDDAKIEFLNQLECTNSHVLDAIRYMTLIEKDRVLQRISYTDLGVEEIGSIYESLLEYMPRVTQQAEEINGENVPPNTFILDPRGSARKTTGSYYTNPGLVNELIKSALAPVVDDRLSKVKDIKRSKERAILGIKVCDPACGSGAFLIAANNYLAKVLSEIRSGEEIPPEDVVRKAKKDVLAHCIYGVDINPLAVELAKVSLWINACVRDEPLNFLSHHIRCGNSLIGATPELIKNGIPTDAFKPVEGDDPEVAKAVMKENRAETGGQESLLTASVEPVSQDEAIATGFEELEELQELDAKGVDQKTKRYQELRDSLEFKKHKLICDLWTASFFWSLTKSAPEPPTHGKFLEIKADPTRIPAETKAMAEKLAADFQFFHWHVEFPEVFKGRHGGFDCVLGNPPWERIKLQEKEFFESRDTEIANAPNAAKRKKLIEILKKSKPALRQEFEQELRKSELASQFLRASERYALTAKGDINTYMVFTGLVYSLVGATGRAGVIVPSGIATDDTGKEFFQHLTEKKSLVSLYDFENREGLFPAVDSRMKFCLLTLTGAKSNVERSEFAFFLTHPDQLQDEVRRFELTAEDFALLNPNTRTCPIFRSRKDADLTKKIYSRISVLVNENDPKNGNPWGIKFSTMFHMSNDSHLFKTKDDMERMGYALDGNVFRKGKISYLPLYEAKMTQIYDHRAADVVISETAMQRQAQPESISDEDHANIERYPIPHYWVEETEIDSVCPDNYRKYWLIGFTNVTSPTNERTFLPTIIPKSAVGNSMPLIFVLNDVMPQYINCLYANISSIVFDYFVRQKIGGVNLNFFIVKQTPILPPDIYGKKMFGTRPLADVISDKVLKLTYTAYDMQPFAKDLGYNSAPFRWDAVERFGLKCELDAIYAHLYALSRDEFDFILETFPIVRRKDIEKYGSYRTKETCLRYYDEYAGKITKKSRSHEPVHSS